MAYHVVSTHPMALNDLETFVAFPQVFFRLGIVILSPLGFLGLRCHPLFSFSGGRGKWLIYTALLGEFAMVHK